MINSDVQLFWAKNEKDEIVIINEIEENMRNDKYMCPVCGSEVRPIAPNGLTIKGEISQRASHFSHFDASKCSVESQIHCWFKNMIILNGDEFIIETDKDNTYKCKDVLIEQTYTTSFGDYKPDITILTECGKTIYFEMNYSNKKSVKEYIDKWLELGNIVVEVDLKTLMQSSLDKRACEFKALFYEGKCFNQKKGDEYYNTIGIHKENILKNNILDNNIRDRIKNLDWFWMEVLNYSKDNTNIEDLVNMIDYSENEDKDIIFKILSKKKCVSIYEDYVKYKVDLFYNLTVSFIETFDGEEYKDCRDYFQIYKEKSGRKNKNIKFNSILLCGEDESFIMYVDSYNTNSFLQAIKEKFNFIINHKKYLEYSDYICDEIIKKYNLILNNNIGKERSYGRSYLKKIDIYSLFWMQIYIYKDSIRIYDKKIEVDILDLNNFNSIINFISENIELEFNKYKEKEEKEKEEKCIRVKKEKELLDNVFTEIINIFKNNQDKILEYKLNFKLRKEKLNNLLYFKDYRGLEFVICSCLIRNHKDDFLDNYYDTIRETYDKKINIITILLDRYSEYKDICIFETEKQYKICPNLRYVNLPKYNFIDYFSDKKLEITFLNIKNTIDLPRYNFIKVIKQIKDVTDKIESLKTNNVKTLYDNKKIGNENIDYFTNEELNNNIYKILYPMIYITNKTNIKKITFKMNIDFTIENGIKKPWLVKDFISSLTKVGVKNINNIK